MPYCLKCGSEVEDTNTFCPNCGTQLKDLPLSPAPATASNPQAKPEENEKPKKPNEPQKGKDQQKQDHGFVKYLAAGLILIIVGISAILKLMNSKFPMDELLPVMLFTIGLVVIIAAVYVAIAGRKHAFSKPSNVTPEKPPAPPDFPKVQEPRELLQICLYASVLNNISSRKCGFLKGSRIYE